MGELLEVVFERILRSEVYQVLMVLLGRARTIIEIQCSEDILSSKEGELTEKEIETFFGLSDDASLLIKLSDLQINNILVPSVLVRVVKYGDEFDIDFNFEEHDVVSMTAKEIMKEVHRFSTKISEEHGVCHWFGGMEPASDEDTRYFTDRELGPLA